MAESRTRRWQTMMTRQLARATADLDREFIADTFQAPSASDQRRWGRAKRKRGRPVRGKGAKTISVSIERGLLDRTDRLAKRRGLSRAGIIAEALQLALKRKSA